MQPEPWLRGSHRELDFARRALVHSFEQVREDLQLWTAGLTDAQVWTPADSLPPLGFQLKHIAGSVDRLTTYAVGGELNEQQLAFLREESQPGASLAELLALVDAALREGERRAVSVQNLEEVRFVGRKRLPTTAGGLLIHTAEHTQRHLGQAIVTAKLLRR